MNPLTLPWLRRVARSPHAGRMVLRGSVATSQWCPGRLADDVDHVLLGACTIEEARAMVHAILEEPDETPLTLVSDEVIWAETPFPGVRARVRAEDDVTDMQIDLGWGDPLAAPPRDLLVDGVTVLAVTPETMFGWKAHGLVEHKGKWRPKDLFDLDLLLTHVTLDRDLLAKATRLAFESRGDDLSLLDRLLDTEEWGRSRGSRRKWETFRRRYRGQAVVSPHLHAVVGRIRAALLEILGR